ncbi:MAG: ABC transporter ATP-binding protein [Thermostichus sp. DG02_5_bins_236]
MSYLVLRDIEKRFASREGGGQVAAVQNVHLEIERGELITLLGPSGCGKTTTLRMVAGFESPSRGELILAGELINQRPPNQREMAMVFQSYALFPHLSVFENVAYGLRLRSLPETQLRKRVLEVLELVGLEGLEQRPPQQLSGGQQQRVALARALVLEPKVLLMDEPLSNLDAKLREQMRTEIRRIQQNLGITTLYVTHDQAEAMTLADRIVIMNRGQIEQVDVPTQIYQRPASAFVADFIGQSNLLPARVIDREGEMWLIQTLDHIVRLPSGAVAQPPQLGETAQLLIRPEAIRLHPQGSLRGKIQRVTYLGSVVEYDLTLGAQQITVLDTDPLRPQIYALGAEVNLDFLPGCLYLLPA